MRAALIELMEQLEAIGEQHEELYDTDVRERMFEAVKRAFLKPERGYQLPKDFGMFDAASNPPIRDALQKYVTKASQRAHTLGISKPEDRLAAFQDIGAQTKTGQSYDSFFGHSDSI
jgi:hypothetical protein